MTEEDTFEALQLRVEIDKNGDKFYYNHENQYHRIFGPAIEYADGCKLWFINGERHRTDGPAAIYSNGTKSWWVNGQYHRTDGPAIDRADGTKEWYINGERLSEAKFLKHPLCTIK